MKNLPGYWYPMSDRRRCAMQANGDCPSRSSRPPAIDLFWHAVPWLVAGTMIVLLIVLGLRIILAPLSP